MTQLIPCPGCNRHVRQAETSCPFCSTELSLGHVPAHLLPRTRLGRAATFAFGATIVGAATLVGCGGESEEKKEGGGGTTSGGTAAGGSSAGQTSGGTGITPVYGAPAAGTGNDGGSTSGGTSSTAGTASGGTSSIGGSAGPVYGAPAAGSGNTGGMAGIPVYGAAPAD